MPQFSRWTNPSLPQTLQMGMFLLYIDAVFGLLGLRGRIGLLGLVLVVGSALAGLGIANEYKWAWKLGVAVSTLALIPLVIILADDPSEIFDISLLIYAIFPVAQFALLVHPQSRQYQKVWFH
jgi:hypothetical protein